MTWLARLMASASALVAAPACSSFPAHGPVRAVPPAPPTKPLRLTNPDRHAAEWNRAPDPLVPDPVHDPVAAARRAVEARHGAIRFCYERRLIRDRALEGRIVVEYDFPGDETVGARVVESTVPDTEVEQCIVRLVGDWRLDERQVSRLKEKPGLRIRVLYTFEPSD